jgi:hypothetical protein
MDIGLHLQYQVFLSDFNETASFSTDLKKKKYSYIKFHEDTFSESQVVQCRQMDRWKDRQTDILCHRAGKNIKMVVEEIGFNM